jgi:molybdopterin synthase sulfur carrier subunit
MTGWPPSRETRAEMKITVEIPTALRRFTEGVQTIECSSTTLPELLGEIEARFPAITKHLRDDSGQIRRFINIYVNEEDIRFLGGNEYQFREGDRVLVVPSIAGGAPAGAGLTAVPSPV